MTSGWRRWWHRLWLPEVPDPWPEGAEPCPTCRRPIPGGIRPQMYSSKLAGTWRVNPRATDKQLIALCPIDGRLSSRYRPSGRDEATIEREVADLEAHLRSNGLENWADLLASSLEREAERPSYIGHSLAIVLRHGPADNQLLRAEGDRIQQLLVDTVALWPPRPPDREY